MYIQYIPYYKYILYAHLSFRHIYSNNILHTTFLSIHKKLNISWKHGYLVTLVLTSTLSALTSSYLFMYTTTFSFLYIEIKTKTSTGNWLSWQCKWNTLCIFPIHFYILYLPCLSMRHEKKVSGTLTPMISNDSCNFIKFSFTNVAPLKYHILLKCSISAVYFATLHVYCRSTNCLHFVLLVLGLCIVSYHVYLNDQLLTNIHLEDCCCGFSFNFIWIKWGDKSTDWDALE